MNNNIDIKTLEAFQDGNHKAFETIFIAYYNKTKTFIDGYIKSEPDAEELTEDLFVNLWINRHSIDTCLLYTSQSALYSCHCISVLLPKISDSITQGSYRGHCIIRYSYCIDSFCLYTRNG